MTDDMALVERQRNLRKIKRQYGSAELEDVLNTYSGRAVLNSILKECGLFADIPTDAQHTFRELGKRDIGLWLRLKILTTDPKAVIIMENESRKRDDDLNT